MLINTLFNRYRKTKETIERLGLLSKKFLLATRKLEPSSDTWLLSFLITDYRDQPSNEDMRRCCAVLGEVFPQSCSLTTPPDIQKPLAKDYITVAEIHARACDLYGLGAEAILAGVSLQDRTKKTSHAFSKTNAPTLAKFYKPD